MQVAGNGRRRNSRRGGTAPPGIRSQANAVKSCASSVRGRHSLRVTTCQNGMRCARRKGAGEGWRKGGREICLCGDAVNQIHE